MKLTHFLFFLLGWEDGRERIENGQSHVADPFPFCVGRGRGRIEKGLEIQVY